MNALSSNTPVYLVECPRDAWQGIDPFIPTSLKIRYLQALIDSGFPCIDFGSFVSPRAVPQVSDTGEVLKHLNPGGTRLLVIVANVKGAELAVREEKISCLGYPFSLSETFQRRNANCSIEESFQRVLAIQELCIQRGKELVIYLSMGFGNPYGDYWSTHLVSHWLEKIAALGINTFSVADTVGIAKPNSISQLFGILSLEFPHLSLGVHLHSRPENWQEKVEAAFVNGCRRFDSTIGGFGGCPFAQDDLVGNIDTDNLLRFFIDKADIPWLQADAYERARVIFREEIAPYKLYS